jgi:hypothetical protein
MTLQYDGIDLEDLWQAIEVCYEKSWTDGLPVVPPTESLVAEMLAAGPWADDDVLLFEPARNLSVTAYKAAVNAVMAGCRPEYFPVVGRGLARHRRFPPSSCTVRRRAPAERPSWSS